MFFLRPIYLSVWLILVPGLSAFAQTPKHKVIFDCDLGTDIDDAYALGLLLASPEVEILGIVMDHGRTADRAKVALKMLYETGREDIPVFIGRETPVFVGIDTGKADYARQYYWAKNFDKIKPQSKNGADFILETLKKYPNEITLITVGPVPNIQDVLQKDKNALKLAKQVVCMFGSFYVGYDRSLVPQPEFNVKADVKSAQMMVNSGGKMVYAGLDITDHVILNEEDRLHLLMRQSPLTNALSALYALWRKEWNPEWVIPKLFDAVAVGMVIWPELFVTRKAHVLVTDEGYTVIDESKAPNATIGMEIQTEEFVKRLMERFLIQQLER